MFIAILGRQPALSIAELEALYGAGNVHWLHPQAALIETQQLDFEQLGGSLKAGRVAFEAQGDWLRVSHQITAHYKRLWHGASQKVTLGMSAYGFDVDSRDIQKTGLVLKKALRSSGVSLRLIPNTAPQLNTATSHHNKLGHSPAKVELLVIRTRSHKVYVAESIGAQNITALAARDQARPKTDAFVGMLPPKLARIMINLSAIRETSGALWDPFCGTGTLLQEARLMHIDTYGSDLSQKMVDYTMDNMRWLDKKYHARQGRTALGRYIVFQADATGAILPYGLQHPIGRIVCETYLGQPFSTPPSPEKLREVTNNCNHIISRFLINLRSQIDTATTLVIAVPAWRASDNTITHLPLIHRLMELGYDHIPLTSVDTQQLLYHREHQVVAREILILKPQP